MVYTGIPISEGPWKLYGLPGLILRAENSRRHYTFECSGVEQTNDRHPIRIPRQKGEQVSAKERNRMYEMYTNDLIGFITANDPSGNPMKQLEIPYNPIELSPN